MPAVTPDWTLVSAYLKAGRLVVGVDEVGRGAWAGPVVAGAVLLPAEHMIKGLADSKVLSAPARLKLDQIIRQEATAFGLGWVEASEVDARGLSWAIAESGRRALGELVEQYPAAAEAFIVLDGNSNYLKATYDSAAIVKADAFVVPVSAGAIIAKVARDDHMVELADKYPQYGFHKHVGYGTAVHQEALAQYGPTPAHRLTYKPVARYASH